IRIFAYFKNFVLVACFLGFGLGCYLSRRRANLLAMLVPLLSLTLIVTLPWPGLRVLMRSIPAFVGASSESNLWGAPAEFSFPLLAAAIAVIVPIFSLICFSLIPLGQLVGWYLENSGSGILAYTLNVLASLLGILLYTLLCFFYQPPVMWFLVAGLVMAFLVWKLPRLRWLTALSSMDMVGVLSFGIEEHGQVYWSAYLKFTFPPPSDAGRVTAVEIDPLILKLGEKYHLEKPYGSPRVRAVRDDARSYVQNSREHFDLIVFSLLDSHTNSSHFTNIRVDNYVYTLEAI